MSKSNSILLLVARSFLPCSLPSRCLFLLPLLSFSCVPNFPAATSSAFIAFTIGFSLRKYESCGCRHEVAALPDLSSGSLVLFLRGLGSATPGRPSSREKQRSFWGSFLYRSRGGGEH